MSTRSSNFGEFLICEDVTESSYVACLCRKQMTPHEENVVQKIIETNWETEEQMVSNLLQNAFLIPSSVRTPTLKKALQDVERPYYILSASVGIQCLHVDGDLSESIITQLFPDLKEALFNEHGVVAMRAFIALQPHLTYPSHSQLFYDILKTKRNVLHEVSISWLVLHIGDTQELKNELTAAKVGREFIESAVVKMNEHCNQIALGKSSPISVEVLDFYPSLNDFDAMLDKQDTLSEFFDDLDLDKDDKLSAEQVKSFLEDIGKEVPVEEVSKEMGNIGTDSEGRIDRDGFIELMFPKFHMQ